MRKTPVRCGRNGLNWVGIVLVSLLPALAWASPSLRIGQLRHTVFSTQQGAPSGAFVIRQAPDGMLWIGSDDGLTRFDGVEFDRTISARIDNPPVRALFIEATGVMWIGRLQGGIFRVTGDRVEQIDTTGLPPGTVFEITRTPDGTLWVATTHGLARLHNGRWQVVAAAEGYPGGNPESMVQDHAGALWVADATSSWRLDVGQARFVPAGPPQVLLRLYAHLPPDASYAPGPKDGEALLDSTGALWVAREVGLTRTVKDEGAAGGSVTEAMTPENGLGHPYVSYFFEDREHDVWVATTAGLERFAPTRFTPVPLPGQMREPLLVPGADQDLFVGSVWQPPLHISASLSVQTVSLTGGTSAVARGQGGTVWFGYGATLTQYGIAEPTVVSLPKELGNPRRLLWSIVPFGNDDLWVSIRQTGLYHFHAGRWTNETHQAGLPPGVPLTMAAQSRRLWLGYVGGQLFSQDGGGQFRRVLAEPRRLGAVGAILPAGGDVWLGGTGGTGVLRNGQFHTLVGIGHRPFANTASLLLAQSGDLWINTTSGVYRIAAKSLAKVGRGDGASEDVAFDHFEVSDGLPIPLQLSTGRSALAETTDGRIWASTLETVAFIDPSAIRPLPALPPVTVRDVQADGKEYSSSEKISLPPRPRDVRVDYTVPYLSDPERVRFRYRLRGYDDSWHEVGTRRQAFFTNLDNGDYAFEVQASVADGIWTGAPASVAFSIAPAYFQTWWFRALVLLAFVGMLWVLQWAWLRITSLEVRARVDERTRLARDLHDTFLQSVQAFILRTHAAMMSSLPPEERRQLLETAIVQAENSLREGRETIGRLRTPTFPSDLADYLFVIAQDLATQFPVAFTVDTVGQPLALARPAFEQLQPLCHEALVNAFRHAHASHIEVLVRYGARRLVVTIKDDGRGIERDVLARSRPGHWGLFGMRERATAMRARLIVRTAVGKGTTVEVHVRAGRIYSKRPTSGASGVDTV